MIRDSDRPLSEMTTTVVGTAVVKTIVVKDCTVEVDVTVVDPFDAPVEAVLAITVTTSVVV